MKNPSKKTTMKGSVGPKGGKGKMAGPQGAGPAKPGGVSVSTPGAQKWGVSGGKGKMFGKQTAGAAQSGTSSAKNG